MPKRIKKVVHEPMWSEKALGVSVGGHPLSTLVYISCDYRRKSTGDLILPDTYVMSVKQIKKYPSRTIKGAKIHIIPFDELEKAIIEKDHGSYEPKNTEGEDLQKADNWKAATQLEFFKQAYLDPMHKSVKRGWEYVTTDKYEQECKANGKQPDPAEKKRIERRFEELKYKYDQFDKTYQRMFDMVMRHENLVSDIEQINAQRMELFSEGIPEKLSPMQRSFLKHYFTKFDSYIRRGIDESKV